MAKSRKTRVKRAAPATPVPSTPAPASKPERAKPKAAPSKPPAETPKPPGPEKSGKREGEIKVDVAARLIMVVPRRIQQLAAEGWIKKPYTVVGVVQGYIRFLQDEQRKGSRTTEENAVRAERARKLKLENDETERLTLRMEDAIAALEAIVGLIKSELAGVAPQVTDDIQQRRGIEDAIDAVLGELAKRFDKACADLLAGRDALEAEPEAEAERLGEEEPDAAVAGRPGKRDPSYTPYIIAFTDSIEDLRYQVSALVCGSQMGKTDGVFDMIGWRLDGRPRPLLYLGPSKDFVTDQIEPRLMALLDEAPTLAEKVSRGKRMKKTRKLVAGVAVRLAWAGSANQLASDQAGDIHVDELDRMLRDVAGEGDPLTLIKARGFTYRDRKIMVTSTPKRGSVDVVKDDPSGLQFWKAAEQLESPIWKLWQSGTRHHWAWPCPQCGEYFIPRFSCLEIPGVETSAPGAREKKFRRATPAEAQRTAFVRCPRNGCVIEEHHKPEMNERGVYVAPGERVDPDGTVHGEPPEALTVSRWVSGLASPFVSFGERASAFFEAADSGDQEKIQGVINTGFGELYSPGGGDAPEQSEVAKKRTEAGYRLGQMPIGVVFPIVTIDVQKARLIWVTRGWGARGTSWLIDRGTFWGDTADEQVWNDLALMLTQPVCGLPIRIAFIDSGFRPGKPDVLPLNRIYDFCLRFPRLTRPTKGSSSVMRSPLIASKIEVNAAGTTAKQGLELIRLDTDHWKTYVHQKVRWPEDQLGAWHLPIDIDDDYCAQIVSEARLKKPSGGATWVRKSKENHFLDCEAMQGAAAFMMSAHRITPEQAHAFAAQREADLAASAEAAAEPAAQERTNSNDYWGDRGGGGGWWKR